MKFVKKIKEIECEDACCVFNRVSRGFDRRFLFESKDISHIYGRLSLIGVDPVIEVRGKGNKFSVEVLCERGRGYLAEFKYSDFDFCDEFESFDGGFRGVVKCERKSVSDGERFRQKNISRVIRLFLDKFKQDGREFLGLYGAFSYDFVRLFEDIGDRLADGGVDDFRLFLYDKFVYFDHLKERAEIITYGVDEEVCEYGVFDIFKRLDGEVEFGEFEVEGASFERSKGEYMKLVENARDLAKRGELFEVVYSNTLRGSFEGDALGLYRRYSEVNPSPYLFYFDFGDETLLGASPEMMVRCERGKVHLRPISGTAARGRDVIEDHENMLKLLSDEKERSELDMLIDLGRNDLARICEPGIEVKDYRFVEKYSSVMHTVAHLTGELKSEYCAFDALVACLNAGTLTGAPKVAAMTEIEKNEGSRRGYYGGTIGYLTFSGDMDTGIIIRAAHIRDGKLSFRVGATLLYDSVPENEYEETLNKANAFLTLVENGKV